MAYGTIPYVVSQNPAGFSGALGVTGRLYSGFINWNQEGDDEQLAVVVRFGRNYGLLSSGNLRAGGGQWLRTAPEPPP